MRGNSDTLVRRGASWARRALVNGLGVLIVGCGISKLEGACVLTGAHSAFTHEERLSPAGSN